MRQPTHLPAFVLRFVFSDLVAAAYPTANHSGSGGGAWGHKKEGGWGGIGEREGEWGVHRGEGGKEGLYSPSSRIPSNYSPLLPIRDKWKITEEWRQASRPALSSCQALPWHWHELWEQGAPQWLYMTGPCCSEGSKCSVWPAVLSLPISEPQCHHL